ncbi:uncharacterized protein LOC116664404 isoform X4 [Camelus ferus]|uniref:Uncharacterized protein LOC116664404 isoform X4 n=1 Tax=Camelus ferus TaxID=419612 RepID=A0A8B8T8C8_CAMFR|nr:uncharacterized protein LOC116664404 isoform X4 [Camelus ferus]
MPADSHLHRGVDGKPEEENISWLAAQVENLGLQPWPGNQGQGGPPPGLRLSLLSFTPSGACGCPLLLRRTAGNQVWMETGGVVVPRDNPGGLEGLGRIVDLYPYSSAPMALRTHGQEYLRRTYLTNAQPNKLFPVAEKVAVKDLDGGAATLNSLDDLRRRLPFPRFLGENLPLGLDILVLEGGGVPCSPLLGVWGLVCIHPLLGKCNP